MFKAFKAKRRSNVFTQVIMMVCFVLPLFTCSANNDTLYTDVSAFFDAITNVAQVQQERKPLSPDQDTLVMALAAVVSSSSVDTQNTVSEISTHILNQGIAISDVIQRPTIIANVIETERLDSASQELLAIAVDFGIIPDDGSRPVAPSKDSGIEVQAFAPVVIAVVVFVAAVSCAIYARCTSMATDAKNKCDEQDQKCDLRSPLCKKRDPDSGGKSATCTWWCKRLCVCDNQNGTETVFEFTARSSTEITFKRK